MSVCNGMPKLPLPRYLREHREEILHVFDRTSGPDYNSKRWRKYLRDNRVIAADLDLVIEKCPVRISRKDVRDFATKARAGGYPDIRRLFLACMVWGYNRDLNGLSNTERALSDPRAEEVLKGTVSKISNGEIREAYDAFHLARCGPAFFTKFFYFVGKEWQMRPLPLILDRHIARFLRSLSEEEGWDWLLFAKLGREGYLRRYPEGYLRYICTMDDWATELGCSADNVEYLMYLKDRDQARYSTKLKEVPMRNRKKAGQIGGPRMKAARDFCRDNGLEKESSIIDDMDWPPTWHLSRVGAAGHTEIQFMHAVRGSFEAMFDMKHMTTRPPHWWEKQPRWRDRFDDYLCSTEGQRWLREYKPPWAPHVVSTLPISSDIPASVSIGLSGSQYAELRKFADEFREKPEVLAKIWILERLRQLR